MHINTKAYKITFLLFLFFCFIVGNKTASAQIYQHNFNSGPYSHPYTVAPAILSAGLSGSSWTNSTGSWSDAGGSTGQALSFLNNGTITLTFTVNPNNQAAISSYSFWARRSNTGANAYTLKVNGTTVGTGTIPSGGGSVIGPVTVSTPVAGLTGTVTVEIVLSGSTNAQGTFRLDDFTLNGAVTSTCTGAVITSFTPLSAPANTIITLNGTGFTNTTAVAFNNIPATAFTVLSDTQLQATVPSGAVTGNITVTAANCPTQTALPFTLLASNCTGGGTEIFMSELYDQRQGNGGMIELYNPTAGPIDLGDYIIQRYGDIGDAAPTAGYILQLSGTIGAGQTFLIAGTTPNQTYCATPTATIGFTAGFNGNDRLELLKNGILIDRVDVPFTGPGYTLIRKPEAVAPLPLYNINDWNNTQHGTAYLPEYCSNLGIHAVNSVTAPTVTQPVTQTICENGQAAFTVTLSNPAGFTYQWKVLNNAGIWVNVTNGANYSGATTPTLTVNQAPVSFNGNQYYCQIISANCSIPSNAAQLYVNPAPAAPGVSAEQPTCTISTGTITVTPVPGATYSIGNSYQAGNVFTGLTPNTYTVTLQTAAGCISQPTTQVINPVPNAPAAPNATPQQPTCTLQTGTITITPVAGLLYSFDGGAYSTTTSYTNLAPGSYNITAQNTDGCISAVTTVTINPVPATPAAPVASATAQPTCTLQTGTITITPVAGLTYSFNGSAYSTTLTYANLVPGSYNITAQNADGCISAVTTVIINPVPATPAAPVASATAQPTCTLQTGTITITPVAGLTYSFNGSAYSTTLTYANLVPGSYNITAQNADGCISAVTTVIINPVPATPAAPVASATAQPTCTMQTGTITITPVAGLTYSFDGGAYSTTTSYTNLAPGSYNITAQNTDGCISAVTTVIINPVPATPAAPVASATAQPTCTLQTGTITITPVAGLTYSFDGGAYSTTTSYTNLAPGSYNITAQNTDGCISAVTTVIINPVPATPAAPVASATAQPTCTLQTGTITITPVAGLTYSFDGGAYSTTISYTNLAPGSYNITAQNTDGCISAVTTVTINPVPATPAAPVASAPPLTCTITTTTITVTPPATGSGYTYSIDGGTTFQSGNVFSGTSSGTYDVVIRSSGGCISPVSQIIIVPAPPVPAIPTIVSVTQPDCTISKGSINVAIIQGVTYSIGNGYQAGNEFTDLNPGTYYITIKNADGCESDPLEQIITPVPPTPAIPVIIINQPDCAILTGKITVNSPLGNIYTYSIDNGVTFQSGRAFEGLAPGSYDIIVRNSQGCTSVLTAQLINPAPNAATQPEDITGESQVCTGSQIQLFNTVTGGTWTSSNNAIATVSSNGTVTGNMAGQVIITYTGGLCTTPVTKTITVNPLPKPALKNTFVCIDPATNRISSQAYLSSNLSPGSYTFTWTRNGTPLPFATSAISVSETGTYTVTATNIATGCSATSTAVVGTSSIAIASATVGTDFSRRQTISVTVTGGTGEYEFSLDNENFQTENTFTNIIEGEYTVYVKDRNGCGTAELNVYALNYPRFFSPNQDGKRDSWNISGLRNQPDARIYIFDRYGKVITTLRPGHAGWDGTYNGERLPATDYWFMLNYRSSDGAEREFKAHFSLLR